MEHKKINLSEFLKNKLEDTIKPEKGKRVKVNNERRAVFGLDTKYTKKAKARRDEINNNTKNISDFKKYVTDTIIKPAELLDIKLTLDNDGNPARLDFETNKGYLSDELTQIENITRAVFDNNRLISVKSGQFRNIVSEPVKINYGGNLYETLQTISDKINKLFSEYYEAETEINDDGSSTAIYSKNAKFTIQTVNSDKMTTQTARDTDDNLNCIIKYFKQENIEGLDNLKKQGIYKKYFTDGATMNDKTIKTICKKLFINLKTYTELGHSINKTWINYKLENAKYDLQIIINSNHAVKRYDPFLKPQSIEYVDEIKINNYDINTINIYSDEDDKITAKKYFNVETQEIILEKTLKPSKYTDNLDDDNDERFYNCFNLTSLYCKKWIIENNIRAPINQYYNDLFRYSGDMGGMFKYHQYPDRVGQIDLNAAYTPETTENNLFYQGYPTDNFEIFRVTDINDAPNQSRISFVIPSNITFNDNYYYMNKQYKILSMPLYKCLLFMGCKIDIECVIYSNFTDKLTKIPQSQHLTLRENKKLRVSIVGSLIVGGNNKIIKKQARNATENEKNQIEYECLKNEINFSTTENENGTYSIAYDLTSKKAQMWHVHSYITSYTTIAMMLKMKELKDEYPKIKIYGGCVDSIHILPEYLKPKPDGFKYEIRNDTECYKRIIRKTRQVPQFTPFFKTQTKNALYDINISSISYAVNPYPVDDLIYNKCKYTIDNVIYDDKKEEYIQCIIYKHDEKYHIIKDFKPEYNDLNDEKYYKCLNNTDYINEKYNIDDIPNIYSFSGHQFNIIIGNPGTCKSSSILQNAHKKNSIVLNPTIENRESNKNNLKSSVCIQSIESRDFMRLKKINHNHIYIDEYTRVPNDTFKIIYNYCLEKGISLSLIGDYKQMYLPPAFGDQIDEIDLINNHKFNLIIKNRDMTKNRFLEVEYAQYIDSFNYELGQMPPVFKYHDAFECLNADQYNEFLKSDDSIFISMSHKYAHNEYKKIRKNKLRTHIPCRNVRTGIIENVDINSPDIWWDKINMLSVKDKSYKYEPRLFITAYAAQSLTIKNKKIIIINSTFKNNFSALYVAVSRAVLMEQIKIY